MSAPILVTGGTGTLGRLLVPRLKAAGQRVRILSRSPVGQTEADEVAAGDLATGAGLDAALAGIEVVLHCAGSAKGDAVKAQHLIDAARRAGSVRHIVYISVVGAGAVPIESGMDRMMFGYYEEKGAERLLAGSGIPWTTLRATQFHDLVLTTAAQMAKLPLVPVPAGVAFQPVDAREVADRLVELAVGEPQGLIPAIGGPKVYAMRDLVRSYLAAAGRKRPIVPMSVPGAAARALKQGVNLAPDRATGRRTWEDFLAERVGMSKAA